MYKKNIVMPEARSFVSLSDTNADNFGIMQKM